MYHAKVVLVLLFSVVAFGQATQTSKQDSCDSPIEVQREIVPIIRVINTAQMRFRGIHQRFASTQELLDSDVAKAVAEQEQVKFGNTADPVPGFVFRMTVGEKGITYSVSVWKSDGPCKYVGAFSDDRGLIFLGRVLR